MRIESEPVDVGQFRRLLATSRDEQAVVDFLKAAPWIPYWTFCNSSGHDRYAVFEFPLGNAHKCDLLILNSYSGTWEALFVEFEPIGDRVFTKAGVPSKQLAVAQRQIDDWSRFIEQHREIVRADMVRYVKTKPGRVRIAYLSWASGGRRTLKMVCGAYPTWLGNLCGLGGVFFRGRWHLVWP